MWQTQIGIAEAVRNHLRMTVVHAAFGELAFEVVIDGVEGRIATGVVQVVDQRDQVGVGK